MRSIAISTDVFATIWAKREPGEDNEDAILRRLLSCPDDPIGMRGEGAVVSPKSDTASPPRGFQDRRFQVHFPDGFEVFRRYLGHDYKARVLDGCWVLDGDGRTAASLNELSRLVGAKTENAWASWFYLNGSGERRPVSELRNPATITTRRSGGDEMLVAEAERATWCDDLVETLKQLGGWSSLRRIYDDVRKMRHAAGRSTPGTLEAVVRRTLENHSSDSENYLGGPDLFWMPEGKGAGVWALRKRD